MIENISRSDTDLPLLFIVMGVSGSGKSTIAHRLARLNSFHFLEADDYHSETAKLKMRNGEALSDDDRTPWINSLCISLEILAKSNIHCCLAYSGLRREHRQQFRSLGYRVTFIHLSGTLEQLQKNLENRRSHFFQPSLLNSQFEAMQQPESEADVFTIEIMDGIDETVMSAQKIVLENMSFN